MRIRFKFTWVALLMLGCNTIQGNGLKNATLKSEKNKSFHTSKRSNEKKNTLHKSHESGLFEIEDYHVNDMLSYWCRKSKIYLPEDIKRIVRKFAVFKGVCNRCGYLNPNYPHQDCLLCGNEGVNISSYELERQCCTKGSLSRLCTFCDNDIAAIINNFTLKIWKGESKDTFELTSGVVSISNLLNMPYNALVALTQYPSNEVKMWSKKNLSKSAQEMLKKTIQSEDQHISCWVGKQRVLTVDWSGGIRVWDINSTKGEPIYELDKKRGLKRFKAVQWLGGSMFALGYALGLVQIWDFETGKRIDKHNFDKSDVMAFEWGGNRLYVGLKNGKIYEWCGKLKPRLIGAHKGAVRSLQLINQLTLTSSGEDCMLKFWNLKKPGAPLKVVPLGECFHKMSLMKDGKFVIGSDTHWQIWMPKIAR